MNRVEWDLYGQTNVDEVTDKTNKGLSNIEKNAKRVENAFSMSISSIFLRFLGPMALLQVAIGSITTAMQNAKQMSEEGFKALAGGEDKYASAQESRMAAFFAQKEQTAKDLALSEAGKTLTTEKFFDDRGFFKSAFERPLSTLAVMFGEVGIGKGAGYKFVQAGAAADFEKANKDLINKTQLQGAFRGTTEGFGNVVGVGANPVLEAVTEQLEVQRRMLAELEIANKGPNGETDFTKQIQKLGTNR